MKLLIISIISLLPFVSVNFDERFHERATYASADYTLRVIASVTDMDQDYIVIQIEEILNCGSGVVATPEAGDEVVVRLPGREMPRRETRIEINLQEKADVGAFPTGYVMLDYRTID